MLEEDGSILDCLEEDIFVLIGESFLDVEKIKEVE